MYLLLYFFAHILIEISLYYLGMDRIVRMWNPYVSNKPVALLRGHNAPIFYLFIAPEENRIFSISTDKCVKVSCRQ